LCTFYRSCNVCWIDSANGTKNTQTVEKGEKISKPSDPTRDGYEFLGWYLDDEEYDFTSPVKKGITLTAKWKQLDGDTNVKHTINFDSNGGTAVASQTVNKGDKINEPSAPTRIDYTFSHWALNGQKFDFSTPVNSDITLTAVWNQK